MVTFSGIRSSSISVRRISYSVWEEAGKPTSISRKPMAVSMRKNSTFCSRFMGLTRAWLPSRRSTLHQTGALVMVFSGQVRSGRWIGSKALYFSYPCFIEGPSFHHNFPFAREKSPGHSHAVSGAKMFRGTTRFQSGARPLPYGPCGRPGV